MNINPLARRTRRAPARTAAFLAALIFCRAAGAAPEDGALILAILPVRSEAATRAAYQPLADYIGRVTGRKCVLLTHPTFFSYWSTVRQGKGYDLALDEAHFTDYRLQKLGFSVLVKLPDMVTYSLVMAGRKRVPDPAHLVGRRIATLGIPSVGAARLNALFPNPSRQPITVEVDNLEQGMKMLLDGKVAAAILPTPFVNQQIAGGSRVRVVLLTEPIPNSALSVGPGVDAGTRDALRKALLDAGKSDAGVRMLRSLGVERLDPATPAIYAGQSRILAEYWGY